MGYMDKFRAQHEDILRAAQDIQQQLAGPADPAVLRKKLSALAGKVGFHLAMEDEALYPRLMEHPAAATRDRAARFKDEMGGLGEVFTRYNTKWQLSAIRADLEGFAQETRKVFGALAHRIERENQQLYPLADKVS